MRTLNENEINLEHLNFEHLNLEQQTLALELSAAKTVKCSSPAS
jgi:hypothetical protein